MPATSIPRLRADGRFHGQMGMFTRALAYILSHGADGLKQVAEDAVLNANYILRSLEDVLDAPFAAAGRTCTRRSSPTKASPAVHTVDLAKALIDEGFHPMTMYFPLVVHGAMLVEPTETESKASLDQFIMAVRSIAERAKAGTRAEGRADLRAAAAARRDAGGAKAGADLSRAEPAGGRVSDERRFYETPATGTRAAPLRRRSATASRSPRSWRMAAGERGGARNRQRDRRARGLLRWHFPELEWQPSDCIPTCSARSAWRDAAGLTDLRAPMELDASSPDWAIEHADAVLSINMVHISPWSSALGLSTGLLE